MVCNIARLVSISGKPDSIRGFQLCPFYLLDAWGFLWLWWWRWSFRSWNPQDEWTVTLDDYWGTAATLLIFVTKAVTVAPFSCSLTNYKKQTTHKEKASGKGGPLNMLSAVLNLVSCLRSTCWTICRMMSSLSPATEDSFTWINARDTKPVRRTPMVLLKKKQLLLLLI